MGAKRDEQLARLQVCLEAMQAEPINPADIAGVRRDLRRNTGASRHLAYAVHAIRDQWGFQEIDGALDKAEAALREGDQGER